MANNAGSKKAGRLGRGLTSLMAAPPVAVESRPEVKPPAENIGSAPAASPESTPSAGASSELESYRLVKITRCQPNRHQPRQDFADDSLQSLADSIRRDGLMQPIVLREIDDGYEIVAGERRWRAAKIAGLDSVPAYVADVDERQSAEWALVENLQREDLNPIERAQAFQRLQAEFGLSHEETASRVGLDRSTVSNLLRLLNLAQEVQAFVAKGQLSMGHARSLAGLESKESQLQLAQKCLKEGWSVRQMEAAVRLAGEGSSAPRATKTKSRAAYLDDLERQIGQQLSTKVKLKAGRKKGSGTISIDFYSLDQFDELLGKLGVDPR